MQPITRIATSKDLEKINDIYNQAVEHKFQTADTELSKLQDRRQWFEEHPSHRYPILVAVIDDEVVGWASLSKYRHGRSALRGTIEVSFYIDQAHQRKGIGTHLLESATTHAKALGYKNIFAMLLAANKPSISLLKKFGYKEWGRLPKAAEIDGIEIDHVYYGRRIVD